MIAILPFFRGDTLPGLLRMGLIIALCLPLQPWLQTQLPTPNWTLVEFGSVLIKETIAGLLLGLPAALLFWTAESVGSILDNQSGASVASVLNPTSGNEVATLAGLIHQAFMMVFLVAGGMSWLIDTLYQSYRLWPIHAWWPHFDAVDSSWWLQRLDYLFRTAVVIAGPICIVLFLVELGFGLIGRFAPRMQVFVLAMPVKSVLSSLMLALYAAWLFQHFGVMTESMRETMFHALSVAK